MEGMSQERWDQLAEGNATQARKRVAADMLIRNASGQILLVDPIYKPHWDLPGGMAEANESPRAAAEREVREELDLSISAGVLLALDWVPAHGPWDDLLSFIFDGGILLEDFTDQIRLDNEELSNFGLFSLPEATKLLRGDVAERLYRALTNNTSSPYCEK